MATKKKTSKKVSAKIQKIVKGDVVKSVAIASVLLNILFLATLLVLTATDTFDRQVYVGARTRYCQNQSSVSDRTAVLGSEAAAQQEKQVDCIGEDFAPYYKEALDKYQAQVNK